VEVFSVGKYKAMGAPGTPLTDDQRELIQSNLAEIAGEFHAAVLAKGRAIPADAMEGQTFSGRQAQRHNLAGMVQDRAEAMRRLKVYHAAVDMGTRAMTTALEDQLLEARTQVDDLTRDYQAQTELLTENSTALDALRGEVETLTAQLESLTTERDSAAQESATLHSRITALQASQVDFDRRLQLEVARVVASTGTMFPASITAAGDHLQAPKAETLQELVAQYEQIVSDHKPTEAAAFYQQHLAKHFTR
jgi:ClpP class serine protease